MIAKMKRLRKLNLGCGRDIKESNPREEWVNVDQSPVNGVDRAFDLNKTPWPFPSDHFDMIYARDVVEHLKDLMKSMKEIHRVSRNNALVQIIVPYWHSSEAFYPDHKYFFNTDSMRFFTEKDRTYYSFPGYKMEKIALIPSRLGWLIPPIPLPGFLFPNVLNLRHLVSYLLGQIIVKIDFRMRVIK